MKIGFIISILQMNLPKIWVFIQLSVVNSVCVAVLPNIFSSYRTWKIISVWHMGVHWLLTVFLHLAGCSQPNRKLKDHYLGTLVHSRHTSVEACPLEALL